MKNGPHNRNIEVDVDISAAGYRFPGLNDKTSEVEARQCLGSYHGRGCKWLDTEKVVLVNEEIRETVHELRLIVKTIDLVAVLGNGSEGDNVVEIESQRRVNVVNKCLHILLGALIERNDSKSGTTAAETLENSLVVFNCGTA